MLNQVILSGKVSRPIEVVELKTSTLYKLTLGLEDKRGEYEAVVDLFGQTGERVYLTARVGQTVVVSGRVTGRAYENKVFTGVLGLGVAVVADIDGAERPAARPAPAPAKTVAPADDDDIPF